MINLDDYDFSLTKKSTKDYGYKIMKPSHSSCVSNLIETNTRALKYFLESDILFNDIFEEMKEDYCIKKDHLLQIFFKNKLKFKRVIKSIMKKPEMFIQLNNEENNRKNSKKCVDAQILLQCGHFLNKLKTITKLKEMTKFENIKCENEKCNYVLTYKDLSVEIVDKELKNYYLSLISNTYLNNNKGYIFKCINDKCNKIFPRTNKQRFLSCECGFVVCACCKSYKHGGINCAQIKEVLKHLKEAEKSNNAFAYFLDQNYLASEAIQCSRCKIHIIKITGCNRVICSFCKLIMCYYCEQRYSYPCITPKEKAKKQRDKKNIIRVAKLMYQRKYQVTL